jgi:hypothetical protein
MAGVYFSAFSTDIDGVGLDSCGLSYISNRYLAKGGSLWDNPASLAGKKMFTYAGEQDPFLDNTRQGGLLYEQLYNVSLASKFDLPHAHAWQSVLGPVAQCDTVNIDNYDLAGQILQHIYGNVRRGNAKQANLHVLQQSSFLPSGTANVSQIKLAAEAGAYIPASCMASPSPCSLHVHFHGCDAEWDGKCGRQWPDAGVYSSGFNQWADASKIIVLYPQLEYIPPCGKPDCSCWDYGPGDNTQIGFAFGEGKANRQLQTVANMADALLANPRAASQMHTGLYSSSVQV